MIQYTHERCDFCGVCVGVCPTDSITLSRADLEINHETCINCDFCVDLCPTQALSQDAPKKAKAS